MAENYLYGTAPARTNPIRILEVKMLNALTAGIGLSGSSNPEGVVTASPGATYLNTATSVLWVKRTGTGSTGWIQPS